METKTNETAFQKPYDVVLRKEWSNPQITLVGKNEIEKPVVATSEFLSSSGPAS